MSVELKKYNKDQSFGTVEVSEQLWGQEPNVDLMQMAVVRQLNNARVGTACTKTRSEVRGGGRKPWKQKGTGRARAGSRTSPVWRGGGVVFGPKPRSFKTSLNRKMSAGALASALSAVKDRTVVVEEGQFESHKTSDFVKLLGQLTVEKGQSVLVISGFQQSLYLSSRNVPYVDVVSPNNVGPVDILKADHIVVVDSALETLNGRLK